MIARAALETHRQDEGRTLETHIDGLPKKVYAKLDDFGEPSQWDEIYDKETAGDLRKAPNCRFVITFTIAEEY